MTTKILLVDDNPTNLKVLSGAMAESGWTILVATDGERALKQAEYALPDLILLDVMMPGINGFETCARLKSNPTTQEIPVIFITALDEPIDKVKGLNLGAVDYITKPFQQEEVLARVGVHLKLRALSKKLSEQNELLEKLVEERTAKLKQAMRDLQQSQLQLVQNEKMATLGQLVAGVAHEINNPVGFIAGNLTQADQDIQNLLKLIHLYQAEYPNASDKIADFIDEIDLEFLSEDLPKMIASMQEGTERIRNISTSLKTFSRLDSHSLVDFNIHEGIDSTLAILRHRIKANEQRPEIAVMREYGEVPEIKCYPGQLNQVFMNILSNAIDAVDESNHGRSYKEIAANPNLILIRTFVEKSNLVILIKDNGCGMSESIRSQVFDHLFTTKAVGRGTGLGLSISRQIIEEKHGGQLSCNSVLGEGTEFIIELPI
ncbi:MAG TPA: hybrid sensor histidine kinase/response regulator [Cyanobacteria bacterium UBA11369]|nr:hybrid sensor histidine kinase/response regulator [Cyanobacteria bacterium UBA11371]HBE35892.1 hybrid sensor histidine kinase/response regulator [Cyanobacteria bacterium UBA11368]HBE51222.1 hybrid sensor histidine kinase/response regulator [Cyanobacteria bacterium UBA11369]